MFLPELDRPACRGGVAGSAKHVVLKIINKLTEF